MDQHEPVRRGFAVLAACALGVAVLAGHSGAGQAPPAAAARVALLPTAPALGAGEVATVAHPLDIDPDEIGAWGQSAGGHLVALLGTAGPAAGWDVGPYPGVSSSVQAVVDMAGPSDLLTMGNQGDAVLVADRFVSLLGRVARDQLVRTSRRPAR